MCRMVGAKRTMSQKIRVAVIGCGSIATTGHLPAYGALKELCEVVAVCDSDKAKAQLTADQFGVKKVFDHFEDLANDPNVDAVSVTTPNALHIGPTLACLSAGRHVLCEKPLGMNAEECRAMCQAAKDSSKLLQVGFQLRFGGAAKYLKSYIDDGKMGTVYYAQAQAIRRRGVPAWGSFIDKEKQGGGPLIDIGIHILDLALHMMGYPKPVSASGKTWNHLGTDPSISNAWGDYDRARFTVEDFAVGLVKFEDDSSISLETSFMANTETEPFQARLYGTKSGALLKPTAATDGLRITTEQDGLINEHAPLNVTTVESMQTASVRAFLESIANGTPSQVPGQQALTIASIVDAIYRSAQTGKEERIDSHGFV